MGGGTRRLYGVGCFCSYLGEVGSFFVVIRAVRSYFVWSDGVLLRGFVLRIFSVFLKGKVIRFCVFIYG